MLLLTTGCSKSTPGQAIAAARAAIATGDYDAARRSLDAVDTSSPSDLCEMAVLYMIVSENLPESGSDVAALDCFRKAVGISTDSVSAYFTTLPADEAQYLFMLSSLNRGMENRHNRSAAEEEIYNPDDIIDSNNPADTDSSENRL